MEYTIQKLANLSGVSTRTLRYYDEIGLLIPSRMSSSGYRIYGQHEVDLLQQILFYRELGIPLGSIAKVIQASTFDRKKVLEQQLTELLDKRAQLDLLIENVQKTIKTTRGEIKMSDKEKFEGFKQKLVADNEERYGKEIRQKYGEQAVEHSNQQFRNMTKEQYMELEELRTEIDTKLAEAFALGDPANPVAQEACELHKKWITFCWGRYSKEAHMGLAQMYVDDPGFTAHYDKIAAGCTVFLRDAMRLFTGIEA